MLELYFDGYCLTNPGTIGGYGVVIKKNNKIIKTISNHFTEIVSNNIVEYRGLNAGLTWLLDNDFEDEDIEVYGDSLLVINQMKGWWRIKKGIYKQMALVTKKLLGNFKNLTFTWIPREKNEEAHNLSQ